MSLVNAYYDPIAKVYNGGHESVTPSGIKRSLGAIYEEYKRNDEQDTVEFNTKMYTKERKGW